MSSAAAATVATSGGFYRSTLRLTQQLNLILWKNLLVTQLYHHYVITALELLLPGVLSYSYSVFQFDFSKALPAQEGRARRHTLREAFLGTPSTTCTVEWHDPAPHMTDLTANIYHFHDTPSGIRALNAAIQGNLTGDKLKEDIAVSQHFDDKMRSCQTRVLLHPLGKAVVNSAAGGYVRTTWRSDNRERMGVPIVPQNTHFVSLRTVQPETRQQQPEHTMHDGHAASISSSIWMAPGNSAVNATHGEAPVTKPCTVKAEDHTQRQLTVPIYPQSTILAVFPDSESMLLLSDRNEAQGDNKADAFLPSSSTTDGRAFPPSRKAYPRPHQIKELSDYGESEHSGPPCQLKILPPGDTTRIYWTSAPEPLLPPDLMRKFDGPTLQTANTTTMEQQKVDLFKDGASGYVLASLPLVLVLTIPMPGFAYRISLELTSGAKDLMEANGMSNVVYWMGSFLVELTKMHIMLIPMLLLYGFGPGGRKHSGGIFDHTTVDIQLVFAMLFFASSVAVGMLVATVATRPGVAAVTGVVMSLTTTLLPVVALAGQSVQYVDLTQELHLLSCLFPDVALTYALTIMHINDERAQHEINTANLDSFTLHNVTLYKLVHAMVVTLCGCLLAAMYVDRVWPSSNRVPEGPLFFLDPKYWSVIRLPVANPKIFESQPADGSTEAVPLGIQPFLVVHKVTKVIQTGCSSKTVLNAVSLRTYAEHVTVLLGTNSSGKSLILKIAMGLSRPSGGTVYVGGSSLDVRCDQAAIRRLLGYCPERIALLEDLSVEENLVFFAGLKDMNARKARNEVQLSLFEFRFYDHRGTVVRDLGYNDRRCLQLAIAMIGSPQYLLLDEPTVGMDLEAKHSVWEMILKARQKCGILLVTNSIDEAELLGDRIAVISQGSVVCCGSSLYLRKRHGAHTMGGERDQPRCSGYRFSVALDEDNSVAELTAFIQKLLPTVEPFIERRRSAIYTVGFPGTQALVNLLRQLEKKQQPLGITHIGVSNASLEDVMLRLDADPTAFDLDTGTVLTTTGIETYKRPHSRSSSRLLLCQVDGLLRKKLASWRRWLAYQTVIMLVQLGAVAVLVAFLSSDLPFNNLDRINRLGRDIDVNYAVSQSEGRDRFLALDFDRISQVLHGVVLKVRMVMGACVPVVLSLTVALRLLLPLEERTSSAKQLQLMTGLSAARYWTITFCIDMAHELLVVGVLLLPFIPAESDTVCRSFAYFGPLFSVMFMFCWSFTPLTYMASLMVNRKMTGYVMLVLSSFFFGTVADSYLHIVGPTTVSNFRPSSWTSEMAQYLMVVLRLLPQYAVGHGAGELQASIFERATCCRLHRRLVGLLCSLPVDSFPEKQRPFAKHVMHCCHADCTNSECSRMESPGPAWSVLSAGWDLLMMFLTGILYLAIVVSAEMRSPRAATTEHLKKRTTDALAKLTEQHPSVTAEAQLVKKLVAQEENGDSASQRVPGLLACELRLDTKSCVIGPLSFHVDKGEVFGVIGVANSGRANLLMALAGENVLLEGSLLLYGTSAATQKVEYQRQIGYCPRENPVIPRLTSREMLELMARLRGIAAADIDTEVSFVVGKVGLRKLANQRIDGLRSCDKRKLSVGLALVGNPKLVILNECTREVDPLSRGRLLRCIEKMHNSSESSIVFASHWY
ncbi:phospholipid-transporting ATPase ABCA3-like [Haemaphysalis longicornis]